MANDTRVVELNSHEHGVLINTLSDGRNELIAKGRATDAIDDVFIKIAKAPPKKRRGRDEGR